MSHIEYVIRITLTLLLAFFCTCSYAQTDCNCANTQKPQEYKKKVDNGENVQVCSQCAALALYQCLCECPTTTMPRTQIEASIRQIESTLAKYKDFEMDVCCPELIGKKTSCPNAGSGKGTSLHGSGSGNQGGTNTTVNNNFPEGWGYLKEYQQLLNKYINEINLVIGGKDPSYLLKMAEELQNWILRYQDILAKLTKAQMDALDKLLKYFTDMMMKMAQNELAKAQNVYYADEAEQQNSIIPPVQTGATYITPGTSKPAGTPAGSDLGNGNGMLDTKKGTQCDPTPGKTSPLKRKTK